MVRRIDVTGADGVGLAAWEFGDGKKDGQTDGRPNRHGQTAGRPNDPDPDPGPEGRRPPGVLLLHGLMSRASTWMDTARWLTPRFRTVALDQRGHGRSEKPEGPYSREAYVADAEAVIEQLDLSPVALVGHSMGALTAWQLAARRPDLVSGVVACDMRASALGETSQRVWAEWFESWPLPFPSIAAARRWFAEDDPLLERPHPARGDFYVELLEEREDGYWPLFSFDHMLRSREPWVHDAHWEELTQVRCPALVVRGIDGELGRAEAQEMTRALPDGAYAEVPDAGHLVHYDQPEGWRTAVEPFLHRLEGARLSPC